jgi:hypothetical protein
LANGARLSKPPFLGPLNLLLCMGLFLTFPEECLPFQSPMPASAARFGKLTGRARASTERKPSPPKKDALSKECP